MEQKEFRLSQVSLSSLMDTVRKNIWMVAAAALILGMSGSVYFHWCYKPVYRAEATVAVTAGDAAAGKEAAQMLTAMASTDLVFDRIRMSSEGLAAFSGEISAYRIPNTNLITVASRAGTPEKAFLALRGAISSFPSVLQYISSGCGVEVLCQPRASAVPENPVNIPLVCALLGLAGGTGMVLLLCLLSLLGQRVQTCRGAVELLDLPVLGALPRERRKAAVSPAYARQISGICAALAHEKAARGSRVFLVTSLMAGEGRTSVAANVAEALRFGGKQVALLEGDLDLQLEGLEDFDYVILDTPPMDACASGELLAEKADGLLLVVRRNRAPAAAVKEAAGRLRLANPRLLGCILNDMPGSSSKREGAQEDGI